MTNEPTTQLAQDFVGTRPIGWRAFGFLAGKNVWQSRSFLNYHDAKTAANVWEMNQRREKVAVS